MAWFDPNASVSSWFAPSPGSQAAAATTPQAPSDSSFLFQPPAQGGGQQQPSALAPSPSLSAPDTGSMDFASLFPYLKLGLQGAGALGAGAGVTGAGGITQGLGGLLNLGMGAATGNAGQAAQGGLGALGGLNSAYGALTDTAGGFLGGAAPWLAPVGSFLGGLFGASPGNPATADALSKSNMQTLGMSTLMPLILSGVTPALSSAIPMIASTLAAIMPALGPAAAVAGPALGVGLALNQALNPKTNYGINKMAGQAGPAATAGIGQLAGIANGFTGDINSVPNSDLETFINQAGGALAARYSPTGAGMGTSGSSTAVSSYLDGLRTSDPTAFAKSNADLETTRNALLSAVKTLQSRGVPDAELGKLASANWGSSDFGGTTLHQLFNPDQAAIARGPAATGVYGSTLGDPGGGAVPWAYSGGPDNVNQITGGPLWSELAYLFGPSQGNPGDDPRVGTGYWDALSKLGVKAPQLNMAAAQPTAGAQSARDMINQVRYQDFTSGGAGSGD